MIISACFLVNIFGQSISIIPLNLEVETLIKKILYVHIFPSKSLELELAVTAIIHTLNLTPQTKHWFIMSVLLISLQCE